MDAVLRNVGYASSKDIQDYTYASIIADENYVETIVVVIIVWVLDATSLGSNVTILDDFLGKRF